MHGASIETPICTRRTTTHQFVWQQQHTCGVLGGSTMECGVGGQHHETPHFHPRHRHPSYLKDPPKKSLVQLNRPRSGVGHFRSCLYKWGMVSSASCECGTEKQTVGHVVLQYPIHRPPWSAWPDGSGRWDNRMAVQHLPRDLVRLSNGYEELTQKKKNWVDEIWYREGIDITCTPAKAAQSEKIKKWKEQRWKPYNFAVNSIKYGLRCIPACPDRTPEIDL